MDTIISINPANNEVLGEVAVSSQKEIHEKVARARRAFPGWSALGVQKRVELLKKVVDGFSQRQEDFALLTTREMGMPISQSRADVKDAISYFQWYLEHAENYLSPEITYEDEKSIDQIFYEPIGVVAVIVPWNFPLSNFVWGAGQNLIVGNTIVFKDSQETALCGKLIEEIIAQAGLPDGVFSEVYGGGDIGNMLARESIDLISFTGSTKVGHALYKVVADAERMMKIVMELGGSAPGIIFEDAKLDDVLETMYASRFTNCGQMCDAMKRLLVHESRFEEVVEKLKNKLKSVKVGNPEEESTDIGPLVASRQLELLEAQVKDALDKKAEIVIGGHRLENLGGAFYEPTLLTQITKDMRVWKEEVFGPVLPLVSFKTEEEAIELANDTAYGLGAYVFTSNKETALRVASQLQSGMVSINNISYVKPCNPFGGYKKSGIGREHGKFGFHELTQVKVVSMEK
ncbi:MAG: hypothetical protein A3E07_03365 [Candidatus Wildermuthbacteria bacterium RIFCSPHIGHO2_12_FULL_45_9]|uniref:Aldehyde dehydrogenase domain-containing protein n=1 Tax=Candidatus Wildermuthbacteria bacterium RIFCSPHIGHO2_02_FULL_45_25 TaxID=1802450 RepID=A0A1G2R3K6_9BACT|nr:MAG: hypothetical protein A2748_00035 [Candidatus Wildermuthbacteria bacterium RIFCSPHIGHO2_01_FULL_45_20]OHA67297.1 MAG: hypothetical protein A3C04_01060 [Candidatus Wildermuthbacteria bacterium RIFCSPHIGHO2_02_FULL_45_25]OHA72329.1 MAG: hypothetical protein A3E07_03365 [Candidatus Wildermuthbacteria bacterium RIFCSPHIGHO2_12_FULL_45_9]